MFLVIVAPHKTWWPQAAVRGHEQEAAARQQCEEQLNGVLEQLQQVRAELLDCEKREALLEGQVSELQGSVEEAHTKSGEVEDKVKVCEFRIDTGVGSSS